MGSWATWVEPDELHSSSPFVATFDTIFEGTALVGNYHAILEGEVNGHIMIGPSQQGATVAWIDTWHTSGLVMTSLGLFEDGRVSVETDYTAEGKTWTWSSEYELASEHEMLIRHYNRGPELEKYLGVEIRVTRSAD